jgi:hypothetical protein
MVMRSDRKAVTISVLTKRSGTTWLVKIVSRPFPPLSPVRNEGGPMKNIRFILTVLTALLTMATAAQAQHTKVSATIPFNFVVGDRAYPAGEYSFTNSGAVLQITNAEHIGMGLLLSQACQSARPSETTKLVFQKMGDYYFLQQIWVAGNSSGRELPRSHTEVRLAQNHEETKSVIVAAVISQ